MQKYIKYLHAQTFKVGIGKRVAYLFFIGMLVSFPNLVPLRGQGLQVSPHEKIHFGLSIGGACHTTFPMSGPWSFAFSPTKTDVTGGAYFEFDFAKRFFAHLELNISARRLSANGHSSDTAYNNFDLSYHYTHIGIPLGLGFSFFPASSPFNLSVLACAMIGLPQENKSEISVNYQDVSKKISPIQIGAMLELRFRYEFVFLGFRYEFSGTDVFRYRNQSFKTGTFSFLAGFQIF